MLDQLMQLAQTNISQALQGNAQIPSEQHEQIASTAGESIIQTIMQQVGGGDMSGIMEMLNGKDTDANNPVAQSFSNGIIQNLVEKNGLSSGAAQSIATMIIPIAMNMLNGKVSEAQSGGIDIASVLSNFTGGGNASSNSANMVGGLLNNFLGGDKNSASNNAASGITNLLGNLFK